MNPPADSRRCARALAILRGLLSLPSGSADDPHLRPLLRPAAAAAPVELPAPEGADDEALRNAMRAALAAMPSPASVALAGRSLRVERPARTDAAPLADKVALVTGAAGAIGAGVSRGLLAKGARVVACDLNGPALNDLLAELGAEYPERVSAIAMDVTSEDSVADGFAAAAAAWGGLDIVVVNAGIAMVAGLMEMELEAFRRLEKVNVEGALLTLAEAGRWMRRQGVGGDVVVISTKNVFAPGAQFGAYSATKAGCHQLARIASIEYAPFDIRVNMVAPDAVFSDGARRSGLWAAVGPSRMKARGLDEKGLEEYYRSRNLLKARVTADHVANAVLFFATRQTPTTGATLPVDGGLPDAAPR